MSKKDLLSQVAFGARIAEDEGTELASYFVETDNWRRLFRGDIDVIYGPKGAGKSALYSLLVARVNMLFDRKILLAAAENPRGAAAFSDLVADPPATEREFVGLWKLYFASLLYDVLQEYGIGGPSAQELRSALEKEGLVKGKRSLQGLVRASFEYVKRVLRPQAVEASMEVEPTTQLPTGFSGRIIFGEPTTQKQSAEQVSVDTLLAKADAALREVDPYSVWILLDRLDVAFAESPQLEQNALRALFRVYRDLQAYKNIQLKVFLRTDIWRRITQQEGFREASHITKAVTINWDRDSLRNLIVRRLLHNDVLVKYYGIDPVGLLGSTGTQDEFFYRVFPEQVDPGANKPSTLDWMVSRTRDGTLETAPREVIHLLNELRSRQVQRFQVGQPEPDGQALFERPTFKEALPEVSRVRLTQTLYAEYPSHRDRLERLRGAKTSQSAESLAGIWKLSLTEAVPFAEELVGIGFFERRGERDNPAYWVPFLYRDALDMVQGTE